MSSSHELGGRRRWLDGYSGFGIRVENEALNTAPCLLPSMRAVSNKAAYTSIVLLSLTEKLDDQAQGREVQGKVAS